jgi:hypothetical protein
MQRFPNKWAEKKGQSRGRNIADHSNPMSEETVTTVYYIIYIEYTISVYVDDMIGTFKVRIIRV